MDLREWIKLKKQIVFSIFLTEPKWRNTPFSEAKKGINSDLSPLPASAIPKLIKKHCIIECTA